MDRERQLILSQAYILKYRGNRTAFFDYQPPWWWWRDWFRANGN